jgi:hypothetical protein
MSTSASWTSILDRALVQSTSDEGYRPRVWRTALVLAIAVTAAAAALITAPFSAAAQMDPDLVRLLRAMVGVKGIIALAAAYGVLRASASISALTASASALGGVGTAAPVAAKGLGKVGLLMRAAGINPYVAAVAAAAGGIVYLSRKAGDDDQSLELRKGREALADVKAKIDAKVDEAYEAHVNSLPVAQRKLWTN